MKYLQKGGRISTISYGLSSGLLPDDSTTSSDSIFTSSSSSSLSILDSSDNSRSTSGSSCGSIRENSSKIYIEKANH